MKIGLTFNLQEAQHMGPDVPLDAFAEFDTEESIRYLEMAIADLGHEVRRIGNLGSLARFVLSGERVDLVFNMAEGHRGRSREAQVPALLEAYDIPYTGSDPLTLALCLDKAATKRIWRWAGLPTSDFVVADDAATLINNGLPPFPLFVKPVYEGTSKGIDGASIVESTTALAERVTWITATYRQPALIETYLPGREFSVGILGTGDAARVIGVSEIRPRSADGVAGYQEKHDWDDSVDGIFEVVSDEALRRTFSELALQAYQVLECRDLGRVDLRLDAQGEPQLLELNPIVGLHPEGSVMPILARQAGLDLTALVGEIIDQALSRL